MTLQLVSELFRLKFSTRAPNHVESRIRKDSQSIPASAFSRVNHGHLIFAGLHPSYRAWSKNIKQNSILCFFDLIFRQSSPFIASAVVCWLESCTFGVHRCKTHASRRSRRATHVTSMITVRSRSSIYARILQHSDSFWPATNSRSESLLAPKACSSAPSKSAVSGLCNATPSRASFVAARCSHPVVSAFRPRKRR